MQRGKKGQHGRVSAHGKSADGLVEIYYLEQWNSDDLDSLIDQATAALPTASMKDTGKTLKFDSPDAHLLFAGDTPASAAYEVHRVTIPAGEYRVLEGQYPKQGESVTIYRLQPRK